MLYKVKSLTLTCGACPTQWEGKTSDGKYIYIRFRGGNFRGCVADYEWDTVNAENAQVVWNDGTNWCGIMEDSHMKELTKDLLDFSDCEIGDLANNE